MGLNDQGTFRMERLRLIPQGRVGSFPTPPAYW